ncbi:MAG: hypothetical protein AAGI53_09515 [Planctomycetota bacterium]
MTAKAEPIRSDAVIGPGSKLALPLAIAAIAAVAGGAFWAGGQNERVQAIASRVDSAAASSVEDRKALREELREVVASSIRLGFVGLREELDTDMVSRDDFREWRLRASEAGVALPPLRP